MYISSRPMPMFNWYAESLAYQLGDSGLNPQVIFVDMKLWRENPEERKADILKQAEGLQGKISEFVHVPPKPHSWQGPNRKTSLDWFSAANARNTGLCLAKGDYIVYCDDLSVLMPRWLDQVRHAMENKYVVMGAYKKVKNLVVEQGHVISFEEHPGGVDSRWAHGSDSGITKLAASALFGCSVGMRTEHLLQVSGWDEMCSGIGMEDVELGQRLHNNGCEVFYNRNMLTYESEELHSQPGGEHLPRRAFPTPEGITADWWVSSRITMPGRLQPTGNEHDMRQVREKMLAGGEWPLPKRDFPIWDHNIKLADLRPDP